jgi:SSS family solute:Na+ symporter
MTAFLASAAVMIAAFLVLGTLGSRKIDGNSEYSMAGKRADVSQVAGVFLGSLAGGATTVGTVQMAYEWGLSAFWFTFGGGVGCLIMGIWLARPLRRSGLSTIPQYLDRSYGRAVSMLSLLSTACGTFLSVVAQFLAGMALLRSLYPFTPLGSAAVFGLLILGFIFLGGIKSYSAIGAAKTALLYVIMLACVGLAWRKGHTIPALLRDLPFEPFFNPFAGGVAFNLSALVSIVVGIICTQIFVQGVFAASDEETARKGVLVTSFVLPTMGFLGVIIGLSLRHSGVQIEGSQALPYIIRNLFHPVIGGIFWAGILVAIVGTAAGLILGISTNLISDVAVRAFPDMGGKPLLWLSRSSVGILVAVGIAVSARMADTLILGWSFLSMGLRGAATFFPFLFAIVMPGRLSRAWGLASSAGGLLTLLAVPLTHMPFDPMLAAVTVSGILAFIGIHQAGSDLHF